VLLLDTSYSMNGAPIRELNEGLRTLAQEIKKDDLAAKRAEIAVVAFGAGVTVVQDFVEARDFEFARDLTADNGTPMGEAVLKAIDMVTERKQQYKDAGLEYYRPWIFLITDGMPEKDEAWNRAILAARNGHQGKAFSLFAIGVEGADEATLAELSEGAPFKLKGIDFTALFVWLSKSIHDVAHTDPKDGKELLQQRNWETKWKTS
jgi:uncharacterized protein YegL